MRGEGLGSGLVAPERARALLEPRASKDPARPGRPDPPRAAPKACFPAPAEAVPGAESGCLVPAARVSSSAIAPG